MRLSLALSFSIRRAAAALVFTAAASGAFATENVWTARGPEEIAWVTDAVIADGKAYAGTLNGVFRSVDDGATWQSVGLAGHLIDQVAAGGGTIFARTSLELHVSHDEGQTWTRAVWPVTVFAVDPVDPSTVYAALTDGVLVKSTDSGTTWGLISRELQNRYVYLMMADSHAIYAASYEGLFKSSDGGISWTVVTPPFPNGSFSALTAGTEGLYVWSNSSFCRSIDSAVTWTCTRTNHVFTRIVEITSPDHSQPTRLFAASEVGLLQTLDRGLTWVPVSGEPASAAWINALAFDSVSGLLLAGNDRRLFRSRNSGASWERAISGLRSSSIVTLALDPGNPSNLWAGASGYGPNGPGLFHSTDGGLTWSSPTSSPPTVEKIALDPNDPSTLYVGRVDIFRTEDDAETWTSARADGYNVQTLAVDPVTPGRVYVGTYNGLIRSDDGARTFSRVPRVSQTVYSLLFDEHRPSRIYAGSYYDLSYGYYGYYSYPQGGSIFVSVDDGNTFTKGSDDLGSSVTALAQDPFQEKVLYAGTSGTGIYRSVDGGTSWQHMSANLPNNQVYSIVADPVRPGHLYAAIGAGVFRSVDGAHSWEPFSTGLEAAYAGPLVITPDGRRLHLGTAGSGIFDLELEQAAPSFPCTPSANRLCLVGNRYALDLVAPRRSEGRYDPGTAHPLSDRSGYFALPNITGDANLPEIVVKMLGEGAFGQPGAPVFYASMTTVPYVLTVTDTQTGQRRNFSSNRGSPLCGAADRAFVYSTDPWLQYESASAARADALELLGGRFTVTLQARNPRTSQNVSGQAKALTDRSGYFGLSGVTGDALFPEIVVKMIDGRGINGNFWFFHSNLTDLDHTLTVTDHVSGAVRTFQSPGAFCGDADISLAPN